MERDAFHASYLSDKIPEAVFHGQAVKTVAYLRASPRPEPRAGSSGARKARWVSHGSVARVFTQPRMGSTTEVICKAMKGHSRYRHLRVDWVGESATESITLCGGENEASGTDQPLCPDCAHVRDALNVCGFSSESLRELFDTLRVLDPSEVKAKMEALRDLGVQMDIQDRSQLN